MCALFRESGAINKHPQTPTTVSEFKLIYYRVCFAGRKICSEVIAPAENLASGSCRSSSQWLAYMLICFIDYRTRNCFSLSERVNRLHLESQSVKFQVFKVLSRLRKSLSLASASLHLTSDPKRRKAINNENITNTLSRLQCQCDVCW